MAQEQRSRAKKRTKRKMKNSSFVLLFFTLIILAFIGGSMIGYGVIGDQNPTDVLKLETWTHLYQLVFG